MRFLGTFLGPEIAFELKKRTFLEGTEFLKKQSPECFFIISGKMKYHLFGLKTEHRTPLVSAIWVVLFPTPQNTEHNRHLRFRVVIGGI